uniref:Uncharacterized protein n=1 Tax=Hanusia phi TaxID=3032 RepID=A0A7S0EYK0_9CRYP|mmetsp:Transcript_33431/g.74992  ORF Transcript_33431/g.74992 Transcript_33431/m.74992 type:complete len:444 (+) Transcript_33431:282-1613(+)
MKKSLLLTMALAPWIGSAAFAPQLPSFARRRPVVGAGRDHLNLVSQVAVKGKASKQSYNIWQHPFTFDREELKDSIRPHPVQHGIDSVLHGMNAGHGVHFRVHRAIGHEIRRRTHIGHASLFSPPVLQSVVNQIHDAAMKALSSPSEKSDLEFSYAEIALVRDEVENCCCEGQKTMAQLAQLLAHRLSLGKYECRCTVTASAGHGLQFKLTETVPTPVVIDEHDSLALAQRQIEGLAVQSKGAWKSVELVDHSVEFDATESNAAGLHRILMHAKPSKELWQLVADSLFEIDDPDAQPLEEDHNMYHIKLLVETPEKVEQLHRSLRTLIFQDSELRELSLPVADSTRELELISQVDSHHISAVMWKGTGIAIQVQSLDEYYRETEMTTMANRAKRRAVREEAYRRLERKTPIYGFSRSILQWMLASRTFSPPPSCESISVSLHP